MLFGAHTSAVVLGPVDHAAIARACGLEGVRVERAEDYPAALGQALEAEHATVIDVLVDPDAYPPVTAFENKLGGQRV